MTKLFYAPKHGGWLAVLLVLTLAGCTIDGVDPNLPTLKEALDADSRFSSYVEAAKEANRYEDMDESLYYTLFVPTNEAWAEYLTRNNYADFSEVPDSVLSRVIWYHRQVGKVFLNDLFTSYVVSPAPNLSNLPIAIRFDVQGESVRINDAVNLTELDFETQDGVIHVTDNVIDPPDLIEVLELHGEFETLLEAIDLAGMTDDLRTRTEISFFAPTDDAFQGFFATEVGVNGLEDYTQNELQKMIRYHALDGIYVAAELRNLSIPDVYPTLLNNQDAMIGSSSNFVFINDSINVSLMDLHSLNATIHIVDDILEFE